MHNNLISGETLDKQRMLNELKLVRNELVKIRKNLVLGSASRRAGRSFLAIIRAKRVRKYDIMLSEMIRECESYIRHPSVTAVTLITEKRYHFINRHIASVLTLQR